MIAVVIVLVFAVSFKPASNICLVWSQAVLKWAGLFLNGLEWACSLKMVCNIYINGEWLLCDPLF